MEQQFVLRINGHRAKSMVWEKFSIRFAIQIKVLGFLKISKPKAFLKYIAVLKYLHQIFKTVWRWGNWGINVKFYVSHNGYVLKILLLWANTLVYSGPPLPFESWKTYILSRSTILLSWSDTHPSFPSCCNISLTLDVYNDISVQGEASSPTLNRFQLVNAHLCLICLPFWTLKCSSLAQILFKLFGLFSFRVVEKVLQTP